MPTRTSSARWQGNLKEGSGSMALGSGAYEGPFTFASRFEDGKGTNPEELIAAAHTGCFSMALSHGLAQARHPPKRVHTTARAHRETGPDGFRPPGTGLAPEAAVPGIAPPAFQQQAETAK